MPLTALCLVLASACLHATWNYQLKKADCGKELWLLVYLITAAVSLPLLLIFDTDAFTRITPTGWLVIALSAPIHVFYAVILQTGYHKADYSVVYPTARGTGPLITILAAVVVLGNTPSLIGWGGITAILVGPHCDRALLGLAHRVLNRRLFVLRRLGRAAGNGIDALHLLFSVDCRTLPRHGPRRHEARRLERRSPPNPLNAAPPKGPRRRHVRVSRRLPLGALRALNGAFGLRRSRA